MENHGQDAGVTQQHFVHTAGSRVAFKGCYHIAVEQAADAGQRTMNRVKVLNEQQRKKLEELPQ